MNYSQEDLTAENGWIEMVNYGSRYHQTEAPNGGPYNAKFVNKDGREVIIRRDGSVVQGYPDKGTFNYVEGTAGNSIGNGGHNLYDMKPYKSLMKRMGITTIKRNYALPASGWRYTTSYWK